MGVKSKKNGVEEPTFDFSKWSYKAQKDVQKLRVKLQRNAQKIDAADPDMSEDDFDALCAVGEGLQEKIGFSMSRHIVSVPREWLAPGAPDTLDWSKLGTIDFVRADRMVVLQIAAAEARTPEEVSGN